MRVNSSYAWVAVVVMVGCTDRSPSPTPAGTLAAPEVSAPARNTVPEPTRVDSTSNRDMRYYFWEPGVSVAELGTDPRARAEAVLASTTIRGLVGAVEGDGFVYEKTDAAKGMVTFRQTWEFRGQPVIVADAYATVELKGGSELVYLGTGFDAGIRLPDEAPAMDEARANAIAAEVYEAQEKIKGKATPHLDQGLRVRRVEGEGTHLAYAIHVERAEGEGHPRPFMIYIDAVSGEVFHRYQAWQE